MDDLDEREPPIIHLPIQPIAVKVEYKLIYKSYNKNIKDIELLYREWELGDALKKRESILDHNPNSEVTILRCITYETPIDY